MLKLVWAILSLFISRTFEGALFNSSRFGQGNDCLIRRFEWYFTHSRSYLGHFHSLAIFIHHAKSVHIKCYCRDYSLSIICWFGYGGVGGGGGGGPNRGFTVICCHDWLVYWIDGRADTTTIIIHCSLISPPILLTQMATEKALDRGGTIRGPKMQPKTNKYT